MKVLILNGSPKINGCTARALKELEETLNNEGVETELVQVGNRNIRGCIACGKCNEMGKCVFDDLVNEIALKFEKAEELRGIVYQSLDNAEKNKTILNVLGLHLKNRIINNDTSIFLYYYNSPSQHPETYP